MPHSPELETIFQDLVPHSPAHFSKAKWCLTCPYWSASCVGTLFSSNVTGTNEFAYAGSRVGNTYTDDTPLPSGLSAVQYDYKIRILGADNVPVTDYANVVTLTKTA